MSRKSRLSVQRPFYGEAVEIDWGNPMANALVGYFPLNEPSDPHMNWAQPRQIWTKTNCSISQDDGGLHVYNNSTSGRITNSVLGSLAIPTPFTSFVIARVDASEYWGGVASSNGSANNIVYVAPNSATDIRIFGTDYGGSFVAASTGSLSIVSGSYNSYATTITTSVGAAYLNGTDVTGTSTGGTGTVTIDHLCSYYTASFSMRGGYRLFAFWNRALTAAEVRSMHQNPYQMLRVKKSKTYFVPTSGTPSILLPRQRNRIIVAEKYPQHVFS